MEKSKRWEAALGMSLNRIKKQIDKTLTSKKGQECIHKNIPDLYYIYSQFAFGFAFQTINVSNTDIRAAPIQK